VISIAPLASCKLARYWAQVSASLKLAPEWVIENSLYTQTSTRVGCTFTV
jgi:hypothetical protein